MMELLRPGDICPCCGLPIQTADPEKLKVLTAFANELEGREGAVSRVQGE